VVDDGDGDDAAGVVGLDVGAAEVAGDVAWEAAGGVAGGSGGFAGGALSVPSSKVPT